MIRRRRLGYALFLVASSAVAGCDATSISVPDPGGPFRTDITPSLLISALCPPERTQLCNDLVASETVLTEVAVINEDFCREEAINLASISTGDFQETCRATYVACIANPGVQEQCPLP